MIKETNVSVDYLKAITGKFDLETIFNLNLKEKNISKLNAITKCKSLTFLVLSNNKISSISGIDNLRDLRYLDLSFNQLISIDGLEYMIKLKSLKLVGNKIDYTKNFQKFKNLTSLEKLFFQEISCNEATANPICKMNNYRNEMFKIFVSLKNLDGFRKEMEPFCMKLGTAENETLKINSEDYNFNFKESKNKC
jgi:Leucine-rich repeat (LRR) protein